MKRWLQERHRAIEDELGGKEEHRPFSVSVLVETPSGIPIVSKNCVSKLPGGKGEFGECPRVAAVREIREELGIELDPKGLQLIHAEHRNGHDFLAYAARSSSVPTNEVTDDEEIVETLSFEALSVQANNMPWTHRQIINQAGCRHAAGHFFISWLGT